MKNKSNRTQAGAKQTRAFTLVEMLVAIGAVALVSVGLAAIFQTIGKTVTTGKRISQLTQQAAILESQMREDFARMTRDGFMVIRHQFTIDATSTSYNPRVVSTLRYKGDVAGARPRRIDELLFFANGEYRTAREDMVPGRVAQSRSARIYYGHGQKGVVLAANTLDRTYDYFNPTFDNRFWFGWDTGGGNQDVSRPRISQNRLGGKIPNNPPSETGGYTEIGINYYASEWTLLRHAALLQRPVSSGTGGWSEDVPFRSTYSTDKYGGTANNLNTLSSDSYFQIAGQPATPSMFRGIVEALPITGGTTDTALYYTMYWPSDKPFGIIDAVPRFNSGVVDIATTDLNEIAMVVNSSFIGPEGLTDGGLMFTARQKAGPLALLAPVLPKVQGDVFSTAVPLKGGPGDAANGYWFSRSIPSGTSTLAIEAPVGNMQSWMLDAMPTSSGYMPTAGSKNNAFRNGDGMRFRIGARMRAESNVLDVRGTLDSPNSTNRDVAVRRGDMMTVGASDLAANCSEFIVEWSWGQTYPLNQNLKDEFGNDVGGQTVWYGRTLMGYQANGAVNPIDSGTNGDPNNPQVYRYDRNATYQGIVGKLGSDLTTTLRTPALPPEYQPFKAETRGSSNFKNYKPSPALVHGVRMFPSNAPADHSSLVSYFGYYDPSFVPDLAAGDPASMPWLWPKMVRITVTLADPNDPSIEQTFQYVFTIPEGPKP